MVSKHPDSESSGRSNQANDAQRLVAEMAELAGGLAHELRNPLSTMMVNLKLLAEDLSDDGAHPDDTRRRALLKVDGLLREAERLQTLFDRFLSVAGPYGLEWAEVNLNDLVVRLVEFFEPSAKDIGIQIELNLASRSLVCRADAMLLRQALMNLVMNAQQAMPDGGVIRLATERVDDWAVLSVADSGMGIPDEDRDRILRPFFSTKATGGGLGLSITRRVVQEHGGTLDFASKVDEGTTFTIRLPLSGTTSSSTAPSADETGYSS